jgi:hypothetical protein
VATVVLASCLALPAYTCDGYRGPGEEVVRTVPVGADSSRYTPVEVPHRPIEGFELREPSTYITLLAYTWPLLLLGARVTWRRGRASRALNWAEVPVAAGSSWMVWVIATTGDPAYGSYLAGAANLILLGAAIAELIQRRRSPS